MDAMGIRRTVLLPIMMGVSLHDDSPNEYVDAVATCGAPDRFLTFGSVHPEDPDKLTKLRAQAGRGVRGLKLHPTMQRFYPDSDGAMDRGPRSSSRRFRHRNGNASP
jgi:predicted TIM-barrel fold metal-dependent hydrolase